MLSRAPFVGIVPVFIAGILAGGFILEMLLPEQLASAATLVLLLSLLFHYKHRKTAFGVCFSVFLFLTGAFVKVSGDSKMHAELASVQQIPYVAYELDIKTLPEKRLHSVRAEAVVSRIYSNEKWIPVHVKALVSIPDEAEIIPQAGDRLVVRGKLKVPDAPQNPFQFDYRDYLRNKGIQQTAYLANGSFAILPRVQADENPNLWSLGVSEWADHQFRQNLKDDRTYGLVKAMLLGRRDDLRTEQIDDYTTSGTVHILSVSGMHVAIIFLTVSYLLGWMKRWRFGKVLYLFSVVFLLGFYALVTGLPPSVQRATWMCIVFVTAEVFSRKHQAMNTLAISAFLILLWDPNALQDVGFQLSYLAMTGIFLLYEPIYRLYAPTHRIVKFVWQISALAFAAQLVTFPLSLYYFHQFPTYFWLVNPFVIAFTNVLLPAALLMLAMSFFPVLWLQSVIHSVVDISAFLTNAAASVPKNLPGYVMENLHVSLTEMLLLYALLFLCWRAYESREYLYFKYSCAWVFLFVGYASSASIMTFLETEMITYAIPGHSVMSFKKDARLYIVADKSFATDPKAYEHYVKNYAVNKEIDRRIWITSK